MHAEAAEYKSRFRQVFTGPSRGLLGNFAPGIERQIAVWQRDDLLTVELLIFLAYDEFIGDQIVDAGERGRSRVTQIVNADWRRTVRKYLRSRAVRVAHHIHGNIDFEIA